MNEWCRPVTVLSEKRSYNTEGRTYGSSRGGEGKLLVHDVVLAEGDDEEDTEEPGAGSERDQLSDVLRGQLRKEVETVHCRNGTDEEDSETAGC